MKNLKTIALALGLISMTAFSSCSKDNFDTPEVEVPVVAAGKGTKAEPFNVPAALTNSGKLGFVKGYIVGSVNSGTVKDTKFVGPFTNDANIAIAASAKETDYTKCMIVKLPVSEIKAVINLKSVPDNLGKEVLLYGTIEPSYSAVGITGTSYCVFADKAYGVDPDAPVSNVKEIPAGSITATAFGNVVNFTAETVLGNGLKNWFESVYNSDKFLKVSAYEGSATKDSEHWLISSSIDLTGKTAITFSFDHAINNIKIADPTAAATACKQFCKVFVSENYTKDVKSATWSEIAVPKYPAGNSYEFLNSTDINLATYAGKKIRIAFKYTNTVTTACTWEVKNFVVK